MSLGGEKESLTGKNVGSKLSKQEVLVIGILFTSGKESVRRTKKEKRGDCTNTNQEVLVCCVCLP